MSKCMGCEEIVFIKKGIGNGPVYHPIRNQFGEIVKWCGPIFVEDDTRKIRGLYDIS